MRLLYLVALLTFSILAQATTYPLPKSGNDVIGEVFTVRPQPGDTLGRLGLRYGMSLHEMMEANPRINSHVQLRGGKIIVPAQFILPKFREGIVINMAELRLYYFPPGGKYVMTFPVAMGRDQWRTPTLTTSVISKEVDPVWNVPASIRADRLENGGELLPERVEPGPDNPLGPYALHLGKPGYLIHGNNDPTSIGKYVSSGCIRMKNADITSLFQLVSVGTPVRIIHYPYRLGWFNGMLYLEAQLPVVLPEGESDLNKTSIGSSITAMVQDRPAEIDWKAVSKTIEQHTGIPEPIGRAMNANNENYEAHPPLAFQIEDSSPGAPESNDNSTNQYSWIDSYKDSGDQP